MTSGSAGSSTAAARGRGCAAQAGGAIVRFGDLVEEIAAGLAAAGIELPALEARLLVGHALGVEPAMVFAHPQRVASAAQVSAARTSAARRSAGEPMAYILGEREFWSLPFRVTPDVLIPRPETELVVETALDLAGPTDRALRILDLGTGSGCILLALLSERPAAWGLGIDRSPAALHVARDNAFRLAMHGRCGFACGDWASALGAEFDLVVANPPYIDDAGYGALARGVRDFEPEGALRAGASGLGAFDAIGRSLRRILAADGRAVIEIGDGQGRRAGALFADLGLRVVAVGHDLAGRERCLSLI